MPINTVCAHAQTHAPWYAYVQNGKGVFDHAKEIEDEEKRAAVLALMAEYSVLCAVATGKADLVAAAVATGCSMNDTDQEGNSCHHLAALQGSLDILSVLLQAGADVDAKNKVDKKICMYIYVRNTLGNPKTHVFSSSYKKEGYQQDVEVPKGWLVTCVR